MSKSSLNILEAAVNAAIKQALPFIFGQVKAGILKDFGQEVTVEQMFAYCDLPMPASIGERVVGEIRPKVHREPARSAARGSSGEKIRCLYVVKSKVTGAYEQCKTSRTASDKTTGMCKTHEKTSGDKQRKHLRNLRGIEDLSECFEPLTPEEMESMANEKSQSSIESSLHAHGLKKPKKSKESESMLSAKSRNSERPKRPTLNPYEEHKDSSESNRDEDTDDGEDAPVSHKHMSSKYSSIASAMVDDNVHDLNDDAVNTDEDNFTD